MIEKEVKKIIGNFKKVLSRRKDKKEKNFTFLSYDCIVGYTLRSLDCCIQGPCGWCFIHPRSFIEQLIKDSEKLETDLFDSESPYSENEGIISRTCGNVVCTFHHYKGKNEKYISQKINERIKRSKESKNIFLVSMLSEDYIFTKDEIYDVLNNVENCIVITDYNIVHKRVIQIHKKENERLFLTALHFHENMNLREKRKFLKLIKKLLINA